MSADEARFDPEQAAIILDRLAGELSRTLALSSVESAVLQDDAVTFLCYASVRLERDQLELARAARSAALECEPELLAAALREFAGRLLDLDER